MNICKVTDCYEKVFGHGYCSKHYTQIRRKGKIYNTRYSHNKYTTENGICKIELYNMQGDVVGVTLIDEVDKEKCSPYKWCKKNENGRPYAVAMFGKKQVRLHRLICEFPERHIEIDHKNHNTLDNRRVNLRRVTSQQNKWNMQTPSHNSSGYKGVYNNHKKTPWVAQIKKDGKVNYLGVYKTAELAAKAYNNAAINLFGKYAHLNEV